MRLILASRSPRRRDLMNEAGYDFEIVASEVEELHDASMAPWALTEENARLKASDIAARNPDAVVIGADTLVFLEGEPIGKPRDMVEAERMLGRLVGKTHQVCTGVCLAHPTGDISRTFHEITDVTFRPLRGEQIREYLEMIDPLDKAGAYAAQDHGEFIIETTVGSWTNVVGLPMEKLGEVLDPICGAAA
ncbi:MAG: nucleoside triphosphate pyrophosphatase [Verrucomicrobiota bacterium]